MPSQGRLTERDAYTAEELAQIEAAAAARGEAAADLVARLGPPVDVWLNDVAQWRTVPRAVWEFRIGGYQVLKKWLSYREADVLGRPLTPPRPARSPRWSGVSPRSCSCSPSSTPTTGLFA